MPPVALMDLRAAQAVGVWLQVRVEPYGDYRSADATLVAVSDGERTAIVPADDFAHLREFLRQPGGPYAIFHDAHAAVYLLGVAPPRLGCTQIAATLLAEGTRRRRDPVTIEECAAKVLDQELEEAALEGADAETTQRMCSQRAQALVPMMRGMTPMLRRRGLAPVYELECALVSAVVEMEKAGLGVDGAAFQRIADAWREERATASQPERIARLDKLISTYAYWPQEFIQGDRIHALLHPLAADSGRFSCTDPNLQQVPSDHTAPGLRACFRPRAGHRFIIADYAQIELRVAAHLAPCDALRAVFREGRDPHRATAATMAGKPQDKISARERQLAKAVNFGFLFGMGPSRFAGYARDSYGVELDATEAGRAREAFFTTFPGIAAWHRRVGTLGRGDARVTVRTVLGRRKRFEPGKFSFNAALNIPVQGTAADGFKRAMVELHPKLAQLGGRGVLCVHDEYIAEVPEAHAEQARDIVAAQMRDAMAALVPSVPIEVEAAIAKTWADKG